MFTMMNNARINVGSQGVQIAERATQRAVAYARERVQSARAGSRRQDAGRDRRASRRAPHAAADARADRRRAGAALLHLRAGRPRRARRCRRAGARRRAGAADQGWGTDVGCEVASLGVQVHGGMGFIEETGAAQHFRDARIAPIYEGTNGIQAADLVTRKLGARRRARVRRADRRHPRRDARTRG